MGNGMQLLHALDGHDGRACADDLGTHLVEHVGEVDDLGLAGSVVDNRGALCAHGSMMRFSVAPTLANSSVTVVPCRPWGALALM